MYQLTSFKTFETSEHLREMKKVEKTTEPLGHPVYETIGIVPTLDRLAFQKGAVSLGVEFFNNPKNFFPGRWA